MPASLAAPRISNLIFSLGRFIVPSTSAVVSRTLIGSLSLVTAATTEAAICSSSWLPKRRSESLSRPRMPILTFSSTAGLRARAAMACWASEEDIMASALAAAIRTSTRLSLRAAIRALRVLEIS